MLPRLLLADDVDEDEEDDDVEGEAAGVDERDGGLERDTREVAACIADEPDLVEVPAEEATVPLELMLVPTSDAVVRAFDWTV